MKINEIFYSIQGEGRFAGTPAIFVRFSGCNLRCPFCDTKHEQGKQMTEDEVVAEVCKYPCRYVVLTGGEPTLFVTRTLIEKLHQNDKYICIETNGTNRVLEEIDWVTVSPKDFYCKNAQPRVEKANEIKVVYDGDRDYQKYLDTITAEHYYLQPCDVGEVEKNAEIVSQTIDYCKEHTTWKISLQTQKILNVR